MKSLIYPDSLHIRAAQGWLELGNHLEAHEELGQIRPSLRLYPDVLELHWQIYAVAEKWRMCLDIANTMVKLNPFYSNGWLHRSKSLHCLGRTQEAYDNAIAGLIRFSNDWTLRYDLACYCAQLGRLHEAHEWLEVSFTMGKARQIKLMALDAPDLEPLWKEIGNL